MRYWLLKTEPDTFSFDDLFIKAVEPWDGVRNFQARNFIAMMEPEDLCLIYHSGKEKSIVGLAKVVSYPYQDPSSTDQRWLSVDVAPVQRLHGLSLKEIKDHPSLSNLMLLKQSRLSVIPLDADEFCILKG
jgi:predicted RNA-binding protein with PUA-like domain